MNARKISLVVAVPLVLITSLAMAQEDPAELLEALDADGNGSLSEAEASGNEMLMSKFSELDADSNAELSADELAAMAQ